MQSESSCNVVLYYTIKGGNLMQSEIFALWTYGKDSWKGKYLYLSAFTIVLSTKNSFCKSGIKNHFHNILGQKAACFANSV